MTLIKKAEELEVKTMLKGLIYGVPGGGKTTCALSAPSPLVIDIDKGLGRVEPQFRTDSVQVEKYEDIINLLEEDLTSYETLVIDTVGKLVDIIGDYVAQDNPKLKQSDGSLTQKGWGAVKVQFKIFFRKIEKLNKNLIFISHEKEDKDGEVRYIRPDISGGAKNDLIKELDFMGYLEVIGGRRTMHFAPSEKFYAKNSIGIKDFVIVPDTANGNTFLSETLLKQTLEARKKEAEKRIEYNALIAKGKAIIEKEEVNNALKEISSLPQIWDSKNILWAFLKESAEKKKLIYDIGLKQFSKKEAK